MWEKNEIKENFTFWLGELHMVFAFLKIIGKYILGSDIDQMLNEAGVYVVLQVLVKFLNVTTCYKGLRQTWLFSYHCKKYIWTTY